MSYTPTPEKLQAMHFTLEHAGPPVDWWERTVEAPRLPFVARQVIEIRSTGEIWLTRIAREPEVIWSYPCPSEAFFDQLLVAIGWQPQP